MIRRFSRPLTLDSNLNLSAKFFSRVTCAWILLLLVAFITGAIRELVLQRMLGLNVRFAHQFSCLTGVMLITSVTLFLWNWLAIHTYKQALVTGLAWFLAAAFFETFILNRKLSAAEILQTYNLAHGEFWVLVLISIGVLPALIFSVKKREQISHVRKHVL